MGVDYVFASEYYASTTGTFVLMNSFVNKPEIRDLLCGDDPEKIAGFSVGVGHAGIIDPAGNLMTELLPPDQEGILYADIDLSQLISARYLIDCSGHYGKGSVAQILYNQEPQQAVRFIGTAQDNFIPFEALSE